MDDRYEFRLTPSRLSRRQPGQRTDSPRQRSSLLVRRRAANSQQEPRAPAIEAQSSAAQLDTAVTEIRHAALSMSSNNTTDDAVASSSQSFNVVDTARIGSSPAAIASDIHAAIKACLEVRSYSPEAIVPKLNLLLNIVSAIPSQKVLQVRSALIHAPFAVDDAKRLLLSTDTEGGIFWLWKKYPELIPLQVSLCMKLYPLLNIPVADFFLSALLGWIEVSASFMNPVNLWNLETGDVTYVEGHYSQMMLVIEQQNNLRRVIRNYLKWCLSDADVLERVTRIYASRELQQVAILLRRDRRGTSCVQHTLLDIIGTRLSPVLANAIFHNFELNVRDGGVSPQVLVCTYPEIFLHPPHSLPVTDDDKVKVLADAIECNIHYQDALALLPSPKINRERLRYVIRIAAKHGRLDIIRMFSQSSILPPDFTELMLKYARPDILYDVDVSTIALHDIDMSAFGLS